MEYDAVLKSVLALDSVQQLRIAFEVMKPYDGRPEEAIAEAWVEQHKGMEKAPRGKAGIDGVLPNRRTIQVKSKKHGAHPDNQTYIELSSTKLEQADDLMIVFVDHQTGEVKRVIGPMPIKALKARNSGRYYISDMDQPDKSLS